MDRNRPADLSDKPLWGVPMTVKDAITLKGLPHHRRLKNSGRIPLPLRRPRGRAPETGRSRHSRQEQHDEFAMGSTTEHSAYKTTANPWGRCLRARRLQRPVPPPACPPASASPPWARIPAAPSVSPPPCAACVGIKPTYGRVSRYGLLAYASSFDQVGPARPHRGRRRRRAHAALDWTALPPPCPCPTTTPP